MNKARLSQVPAVKVGMVLEGLWERSRCPKRGSSSAPTPASRRSPRQEVIPVPKRLQVRAPGCLLFLFLDETCQFGRKGAGRRGFPTLLRGLALLAAQPAKLGAKRRSLRLSDRAPPAPGRADTPARCPAAGRRRDARRARPVQGSSRRPRSRRPPSRPCRGLPRPASAPHGRHPGCGGLARSGAPRVPAGLDP